MTIELLFSSSSFSLLAVRFDMIAGGRVWCKHLKDGGELVNKRFLFRRRKNVAC